MELKRNWLKNEANEDETPIVDAQQDFDKEEYLRDVAKIRYVFIKMLEKYQMIREEGLEKDAAAEIVPYFGHITPNGAFVVEFSYGYPIAFLTPFGKVKIGIPIMTKNVGNYSEQEKLYQEIEARFGMVMVERGFKKQGLGEFGPYCALTRLPWKEKEKFPAVFQRVISTENRSYAAVKATKRASEFLMQASEFVTENWVNKKSRCLIGQEKNNTAEIKKELI